MTTNLLYSLKVWLTSVVVAPVFYIIIDSYQTADIGQNIGSFGTMYTLLIFVGGVFSFLTWIIFFILTMLIGSCVPNEVIARSVICVIGIILVLATFRLTIFEHGFIVNDDLIYLMLANCLCIGAGTWIYKFSVYKRSNTSTHLNE